MAIEKGQITSGGSVVFPRTSIDNIVESTENEDTYIAYGGKISASYLDLQDNIKTASGAAELEKAPTTLAVQNYISDISASVSDVINGTNDTNVIDVDALRGALTAGQAVDVTSVPDQTITGDYKGTFTTTSTTLGFASFPKFAPNLKYLMIADITVASARNITPSGTWLDGTASSKALVANTPTRVAMLFNAVNKGKFTFSGSGTVTVSNLREYEVTACTAESVAYIASLNNPDAFSDYYLVKQDMIQPWTYIIDMGNSPAVTIASGLSYKLNASTGTHQLTVDACPTGYDGRDAIIRIRLGGNGVIQTVEPLQLGGALVPYAINNCVVRFRDGEAVLLVEDTLAGYVVSVNSGTDNGSLPYGLAKTGVPYIAFSPNTNGTPVQISGATTAPEEVTVVGNGYDETILTGEITCTSKTTVANLGLQNVQVTGGVMTLGDAYIPSGSTVAVSGGGLAVEKVTGAGETSVIDLGGTTRIPQYGINVSGVAITNGYFNGWGGAFIGGGNFVSCFASGNVATHGGFIYCTNLTSITSCTITGNGSSGFTQAAGGVYGSNARIIVSDSVISGNVATRGADIYLYDRAVMSAMGGNTLGETFVNNASVTFAGSNKVDIVTSRSTTEYGSVTLTSGAILDLTGNTNPTPIAPGGGIQVQSDVQVIPTGGTSYATYLDPREYATITKEANTTPANYVYGYAQRQDQLPDASGRSKLYVPIELKNNIISKVESLDKTKMSCHERRIAVMDDLASQHVNYYVNPEDLTKKMDGTASVLDGTDGDVMTEFNPYYRLKVTLAPQNDTETRECVLMSRYPFTYTDSNNIEHVAERPDAFKISPDGKTYRPQYMGYYQATTVEENGVKKLRSISSTESNYVYPTVSLTLGPTGSQPDSQDSFLNRAIANGGSVCNEMHYEILFDLFITDKLSCDTQGAASVGFSNMSGNAWGTIYPRRTGYTNKVSNFYGGQTLADEKDTDIVPLWSGCAICTVVSGTVSSASSVGATTLSVTIPNVVHVNFLNGTGTITLNPSTSPIAVTYKSRAYANGVVTFTLNSGLPVAVANNTPVLLNSLLWNTVADRTQYTTDANGVRTVTAFGWRNGTDAGNYTFVYTKFADGMPEVGDKCYSDSACTIEVGEITIVNTGTAQANRVTSCKYFIENPWGSLWQNLAGFLPIQSGATIGYFKTTSTNRYKELLKIPISEAGTSRGESGGNAAIEWVDFAWAITNNYVLTWNMDAFLPTSTGAYANSAMKSYFYQNNSLGSPRAGLRGGPAYYGSDAGLGSVGVYNAVGGAYARSAGRLSA